MDERSLEIGIGLHCEATPELNEAIRRGLSYYLFDIKEALGNGVELEEWDRGWTRIWEPVALAPFDTAYGAEVTTRFARYVAVLEPMLEDDLPAEVRWSR